MALAAVAVCAACGPIGIGDALSSSGSSDPPDHTVPETFLSGPAGYSNLESVEFEFSSNESKAKFEGRLDCGGCEDDEGWMIVKSPYETSGVLAEGPHLFEVRAFDSAGNVDASPAVNAWIVDRTPPVPPTTLSVDPEETTSLKLAWPSGADGLSGVAGYRVYYENLDSSAPPETANEGASGFSVGLLNGLFLTGLQPCNDLRLWLTAVDQAGNESGAGTIVEQRTWCGWDGTFADVALIPLGAVPESLVAHDFSGDGILDLAVQTTEDIRLLPGDGTGSFVASLPILDAGDNPVDIAIGDFNGDIFVDLVAVNAPTVGSPRITVFEGLCGGGLSPAGITTNGTAASCLAAAGWDSTLGVVDGQLEDITGDTFTDVFVGGAFGARYYLGCKGMMSDNPPCSPATFQEICTWSVGGAVIACSTSDFDDDDREEVVVLTDQGTVSVLLAQDTGGGDAGNYCGGMSQAPPKSSNAGLGASSVVAADLDADGLIDLVVPNAASARVSVLLGNGPDTFSSPIEYDVGASSHAAALADLDGDGITDLVVATDVGFTVLLGNGLNGIGDATFSGPLLGPVTSTPVRELVAHDFDGDDIVDVAMSLPDLGAIYVVRGGGATQPGTGFFSSPLLPPQLTQTALDVLTGDFNADGIDDLAVGSVDKVTTVYVGSGSEHHGDGTFNYGAGYLYAESAGPDLQLLLKEHQRQVGDFNGDGIPDLVVCSCKYPDGSSTPPCSDMGDLQVRLALGDAAGTLGSEIQGCTTTIRFPIVADFDRDGFQDLAAALADESISVRRGNASGSLDCGSQLLVQPAMTDQVTGLTAADLDRDGRLDLAMVTSFGEVRVALQVQDPPDMPPTFEPQALAVELGTAECSTGFFARAAIVAGDFDGNGIPDLAVVGDSPVYVLPGLLPVAGCGAGSVAFGPVACFAPGSLFTNLVIGDFNEDGTADLVAVEARQVVLLAGTGDGGFAAPVAILAGTHLALTIGDYDTDGALDLALSNTTPTLSLLFGGAQAP